MKKAISAHQSLPVVRAMSTALSNHLKGFTFEEAYTLNKDELVLLWRSESRWWYIKMITQNQTCYFLSGDTHLVKPSNAQPCFELIWGKQPMQILQHEGNRSFSIQFDGYEFVFKCYGALANVVLYQSSVAVDLFRKQIANDWKMTLAQAINTNQLVPDVLLPIPTYFYVSKDTEGTFLLTIEQTQTVLFETESVWLALHEFAKRSLSQFRLQTLKSKVLHHLQQQQKRIQALILKTQEAIHQQQQKLSDEEIGHLLMANLHAFTAGMHQVSLFDFNNNAVVVKLKKDLNPQQNAAYYYRKAKLQKNQKGQLESRLVLAKEQLNKVTEQLATAQQTASIAILEKFLPSTKTQAPPTLFKSFTILGFDVWVGKSAANNDQLTQRYAHKNDLWLHAKDVSGSHVVVKNQSGKSIPQPVLEKAAQLAAYYSKLKGSDWVPVSYTLKKYVRKPKGAAPGAVVVDKEKVILVKPELPYEPNQF
ncbi:MAG: NFACT RNA binding domain-containing protein [Bacteroidia bacterium]|jgi:predicted ribosome quality control (RQC) complex YloA/Tae2 family protein|nr:NFACT RNA binding domain-containing protein [Bacteroidia bacterium]